MFEKLPDELKQDALFYLWRYEQRNGYAKPTKMPCRLDGQRASSTDRAHFCFFKGQSFLKTTNFSKTVDLETSLMLIFG